MKVVEEFSLHLKNKILPYHRYMLSKLNWNLAIADFDITQLKQSLDGQLKQSLDSKNNQFNRTCLEIAIVDSYCGR